MGSLLNIDANRSARKWTRRELIGRFLWELLSRPLFAWTPRPLWSWRRMILRLFGARIGRQVHIFPSVKIAIPWKLSIGDQSAIGEGAILYSLGTITIGERVTISQYAHICAGTHDYSEATMSLLKLPITIHSDAWICTDVFVGPGITVGERAVLGARSVALKDITAGSVVGGNPARVIKMRPPVS